MTSNYANLPRIVECGQVSNGTYPRADTDTLAIAAPDRAKLGNNASAVKLLRVGIGYEIAGSCMRLQDHVVYRVRWFDAATNAYYGQGYATEGEARAHFARITVQA